jgi:hypothetical protein
VIDKYIKFNDCNECDVMGVLFGPKRAISLCCLFVVWLAVPMLLVVCLLFGWRSWFISCLVAKLMHEEIIRHDITVSQVVMLIHATLLI